MQTGGYIGAYRLEQPIGEGGMGSVWKARHPTLDRPVALKLIRSEVKASPQAREAFLREVRVLSRLHGPQILQVTDFGFTETGDPYMVTEFLEGEDLLARVRRQGPLDPGEAVHVGIEVLKALAEAHLVGLVHRDLKPGNVFLQKLAGGARTAVKVLDFGVAKLLEADDEDTLWPGARLKGSPRYMAPEQVRGGAITPATDIYAFGAMMYRVLTGKPVFAGDRDTVLRSHVELAPSPMARRSPGLTIPDELEDIVLGCLEKDPADRPGSAGALQARMERLARRLEDDASGVDDAAPGGLALDWSVGGDIDARPSGSLPAISGSSPGDGSGGDVASWFRTTGDLSLASEAAAAPESHRVPTGGWQLDTSASDSLGDPPPKAAAPGPDLGGWGIDPPPAEPAPTPPPTTEPALELELDTARRAPPAGGSMAGVQIPTGGLELEAGDDDGGLELAFDPASRGAPAPPAPEPRDDAPAASPDAQPDDGPPPPEVDAGPARRNGPVAGVQTARVDRTPWHEEHRVPLIAGGGVALLLILVWIGRSAFIDEAGVAPPDAAVEVAAAPEPRRLDLGGVPVALDRGLAMLEAPPVARGPASRNGAPSADERPTVLIRPDPPPATFTRVDDGEVICEEAETCRVPIDVDVRVTRKGYRRLTLKGDDLYDRRGSTWRIILRR